MFGDNALRFSSNSATFSIFPTSLTSSRLSARVYRHETSTMHQFLPFCVCLSLISPVSCGSVAVYGNNRGHSGKVSENWGVLSQGTQIFLLILGVVLCIFGLYMLYKVVRWCRTDPRK